MRDVTSKAEAMRYVTARSAETRQMILEGAVDCICAVGIHRMTLTKVADFAKVSRGGLKYYYTSIDGLLADLYPLVMDKVWSGHENAVRNRPAGSDPIAYAVSMIGMVDVDRYKIARMEILAIARTTPTLLEVVQVTTSEIDVRRRSFVDEIFGEAGISRQANFIAANDMSDVLDDWLQVHPFAHDREQRIALVNRALRLSLFMLWRTPSSALEADGKPRIRVSADKDGARRRPGTPRPGAGDPD